MVFEATSLTTLSFGAFESWDDTLRAGPSDTMSTSLPALSGNEVEFSDFPYLRWVSNCKVTSAQDAFISLFLNSTPNK